jgi:putative membrane protein
MKPGFFIGSAIALTLAACGPSQEETMTEDVDGSEIAADTTSPGAATAEAAVGDAQQFADNAAASDMYEIEAGKLAQKMGKSQAVKDFGGMMVTDHTKSTADLKAAAGQDGSVTVAPKLTAKQQSDLDALKAAGDSFDATYKQQQVAAHQQALSMLQGYAGGGQSQPLKSFAAKTAPVVEGHLEKARQLP